MQPLKAQGNEVASTLRTALIMQCYTATKRRGNTAAHLAHATLQRILDVR